MRELTVIAALIFMGYLAQNSARYVMSESCRIYVELTHAAGHSNNSNEYVEMPGMTTEMTASNSYDNHTH